MENSSLAYGIQSLVNEIKKDVFSTTTQRSFHGLVEPSAYDTAWLAMIPDPSNPDRPLFQICLNWILDNQNENGLWGDDDDEDTNGLPTIDALPATLACLVALKKWNVGEDNISKGLAFFHANVDMILKENARSLPRWFTIVFPAMVDLAQATGLHLNFLNQPNDTFLSNLFIKRNQILEREELVDEWGHYSPIFAYLECFRTTIIVDQEDKIYENLCRENGSVFRSPSATAHLFMATANTKSLKYLNSLVQNYPNGVPARYPVDEDQIKLCMLDHIQRLGLAEHFSQEIEQTLSQIYRDQEKTELPPTDMTSLAEKLHNDSLAFRLLRMQGYHINPRKFCWFLEHEDILAHLEENHEYFTSLLYNVYRATDLMFPGENELEEARSFSRKLLQKSLTLRDIDDNLSVFPELLNLIERELSVPWIARMDHLDNRLWIEKKFNPLWIGKASYYRLSSLQNKKLLQLAVENFELRQSTYRNELEELKRWSKEKGLVGIGFGREKTMYTYFAVATSTCLPHDSIIRLIVAKSAIVITVADDFYDMEGSLSELQLLTDAVQRWDGKNLGGPSKIIFNALEDLVAEIATRYYTQHGSNITGELKNIWRGTFGSWMRESRWSQRGYKPSMEEYLETGIISISADTVLLPAACFLTPSLPTEKMKPALYEGATKLLMTTTRLLNDIQSYQKEKEDGKMNYVLLHLDENPEGQLEDSIAYVKDIVDKKRKEFLEDVLMTDDDDDDMLPKSCKLFHLSCFKVFQMFFNSYNLFDSEADLIHEIMKAFYIPFEQHQQPPPKPVIKVLPLEKSSSSSSGRAKVSASLGPTTFKHKNKVALSFIKNQVPSNNYCSLGFYSPKTCTPTKLKSCFI